VRLWVRQEERRPDPAPLQTNDRLVFSVGLAGWLVAGAVSMGMLVLTDRVVNVSGLVTIAVGLALGVAGWIASARR
jgi:hypothetical protein